MNCVFKDFKWIIISKFNDMWKDLIKLRINKIEIMYIISCIKRYLKKKMNL